MTFVDCLSSIRRTCSDAHLFAFRSEREFGSYSDKARTLKILLSFETKAYHKSTHLRHNRNATMWILNVCLLVMWFTFRLRPAFSKTIPLNQCGLPQASIIDSFGRWLSQWRSTTSRNCFACTMNPALIARSVLRLSSITTTNCRFYCTGIRKYTMISGTVFFIFT